MHWTMLCHYVTYEHYVVCKLVLRLDFEYCFPQKCKIKKFNGPLFVVERFPYYCYSTKL